jgi:inner membrane protein
MDNLTHTICALTLSRTGLGKLSRFTTATLVVSSNFPDLDFLVQAAGRFERGHMLSHRGITHSLAALPFEAVLVATVVYAIGRLAAKSSSRLSWRALALVALIGVTLHLLLDLTNDYGVRVFLPFTANWYAWDLTSVVDFWLIMILAVGWMFPKIIRLGSPGHGQDDRLSRLSAVLSLVLLTAYVGVKEVSHRYAVRSVEAHSESPTGRLACLPRSISPLHWTGVLENETGFEILDVETLRGVVGIRQVFPKDCPERLQQAARTSRDVQALLSFARFPIFQAQKWITPQGDKGHTVLVEDLRWVAQRGYIAGPCVRLWLTGDLAIVGQKVESWR